MRRIILKLAVDQAGLEFSEIHLPLYVPSCPVGLIYIVFLIDVFHSQTGEGDPSSLEMNLDWLALEWD